MILQRLVEYYDRLAGEADTATVLPRPGFSLQKISFCVVLNPDGTLNSFESLFEMVRGKKISRQLLVPGQSKPSGSGINPCFLWDNATYMLGFKTADPADLNPERTRERAIKSLEAFRERHLAAERVIDDPSFHAVCNFLQNWSADSAEQNRDVLDEITGSFGVFRIAGQMQYVHDSAAVMAYLSRLEAAEENEGSIEGNCLVTGKWEPIARLHEPKIKNVRGAQPSGALLVSFNDAAYESFGKSQSYNAPVGTTAVFKYANSLNYLLNRSDRRIFLGDATVVFWAERATPLEQFVSDLFDDPPADAAAPAENEERARQARLFLTQIRDGVAAGSALDEDDSTRFLILGLSPNASRIAVRFWCDSTVGQLKALLGRHLRDIDLAGARDERPLTVKWLTLATGRAETDHRGRFSGKYDADSISPVLAGAMARAILTGGPYPHTLLTSMLNRLRADGVITHPRIAAIKACLNRNSRLRGNPLEVSVALDRNRIDAAYLTGRLFALLEKVQLASADSELNTTIKDRYFSSASMTPAVVFPRLLRLSQYHLAKLETGLKIFFERQIGEVVGMLDGFARHFTIEEQGLFAIGYFHQRQDLYTGRKSNTEGVSQ